MRKVIIAFWIFALSSVQAWAWGNNGHRIIGAIADRILKDAAPTTREKVETILEGVSVSEASVWADCAKGYRHCQRAPSAEELAFAANNPRHHKFHYTDVAIQQTEYRLGGAGTRPNDVVQVLIQSINVLRGQAPNHGPAVLNQKEALWLLDHLVGDVHQPLHVGELYFDKDCQTIVDPNVVAAGQPDFGIGTSIIPTTGGNDLKFGSKNLHSYWDADAVIGAARLLGIHKKLENFAEGAATAILSNPPTAWVTAGNPDTWPAQWATETLPLAKDAYSRVTIGQAVSVGGRCNWPVSLDRAYTDWANKQVVSQLGKAGFRLAALLRAIFP
jgi:S1/P1 Nuclease